MRMFFNTNTNQEQGFTLIEVMVAVSIFAIVMTVGIAALLSLSASYKKSQTQRDAYDSLNFIIDTMGRDIRTGTRYVQSPIPSSFGGASSFSGSASSSTFSFRNQEGCDVTYDLDTSGSAGVITRHIQSNTLLGCIGSNNPETLTNPGKIDITGLHFYLRGASNVSNDTEQPFVTFVIQGTTQLGSDSTDIVLQSSVTQRLLDIPSGS